jgi:hypothetical protein
MNFAKVVFRVAGIWGLLVLTPLYFMSDLIGQKDPPPITHPAFFYGFVGVALAWQIAFLVIAKDPVGYRALMIPSVIEKVSYAVAVAVLVWQGRTRSSDLVFACTDSLLAVLFVMAYPRQSHRLRCAKLHCPIRSVDCLLAERSGRFAGNQQKTFGTGLLLQGGWCEAGVWRRGWERIT